MDKILITGVADSLGISLANSLLEDENTILFAMDNFIPCEFSNLYTLLKNDRFAIVDLADGNNTDNTCNWIFHLLLTADLKNYFDDKYSFCTRQFDILKNVLNYTKLSGAKLVITIPFCDFINENKELFDYYNFINFIVGIVNNFAKNNKTYIRFARISEIYGQNCPKNDSGFIAQTIFKAYTNQNLSLEYDKSAYFTYVQDVALALKKYINNYTSSQIIDLSATDSFLYSDIAKLIFNLVKSNSKVEIKNQQTLNPSCIPNLKPAKEELNTEFNTTILDGITKTAEFIKLMYFS